jgi:hypothetical protein
MGLEGGRGVATPGGTFGRSTGGAGGAGGIVPEFGTVVPELGTVVISWWNALKKATSQSKNFFIWVSFRFGNLPWGIGRGTGESSPL